MKYYLVTKSFESYGMDSENCSYTYIPMAIKVSMEEAVSTLRELTKLKEYQSEDDSHTEVHYIFSIFEMTDSMITKFINVPVYGTDEFFAHSTEAYHKYTEMNNMTDKEFIDAFTCEPPKTYERFIY